MGKYEILVKVKRPLERLHGLFYVASFLENGRKEITAAYIQLVSSNSFFTPRKRLSQFALVSADPSQKRQRFCISWILRQPYRNFFRRLRIAALFIQH